MAVATGGEHSVALTNDGYVYTWGKNTYGQLGFDPEGTVGYSSTYALQVVDVDNIGQISGEGPFTMVLYNDGKVGTWGNNWFGQLATQAGIYGYGEERWQPDYAYKRVGWWDVYLLDDICFIAAGHFHSLAIDGNDIVWTWGRNSDGQLGDGSNKLNARAQSIGTL